MIVTILELFVLDTVNLFKTYNLQFSSVTLYGE